MNEEKEWWMVFSPKPQAKTVLFVFPYAGGAPNTFSQWNSRVHSSIEVRVIYLPGRLGKSNLKPILDWRELSSKIGTAIMNDIQASGKKYAIYGHSFGGLLGYLTLLHIRESDGPLPVCYLVGSKKSPQTFVPPAQDEKLIHDFTIEEMRNYYLKNFAHGAPKDFLKIPGMIDMIAKNLQSDLGMNQKFWWSQLSESEQRKFEFPIHSFFGERDDRNNEDDLLEWEKLSSSSKSRFFHYEGDHFFCHDDQNVSELLSDIESELK